MSTKSILQVTSSGRYEGSITRQVADLVVTYLEQKHPLVDTIHRDVATGLPFVDEAWINANFTAPDERNNNQKETLSFSDGLVAGLQKSETIIIAAPIYNFSIPAALKAWIDLIARANLTFRYSENGPVGLLEDKKVIVVMASGGVPVGSEMDMASGYLKLVLGFVGISNVSFIDATKINYSNAQGEPESLSQIGELIG